MVELAGRHGVVCVEGRGDLVGLKFGQVVRKVRGEGRRGGEGAVVVLETGAVMKVKTKWWLGREYHRYERWLGGEHRERELERRRRKVERLQVQELRVVVKGLPGGVSPSAVLGELAGAVKVEAFYARTSGRRGAVVVSFGSRQEQQQAVQRGWCVVGFHRLLFKCSVQQAYSSRSSSNSWHVIRTWHV